VSSLRKNLDTEDIFSFLKDVHKIGNTGDAGKGLPIPPATNGQVITGATYHGGEYVGGGGVGILSAQPLVVVWLRCQLCLQNIAETAQVQALATEQLVGLLSNYKTISLKIN
jgi:hypothetical protein